MQVHEHPAPARDRVHERRGGRATLRIGSERVRPKTRVRGFDLGAQHRVRVSARLKREHVSGKSLDVRRGHLPVQEGIGIPPRFDPRNVGLPGEAPAPAPPTRLTYLIEEGRLFVEPTRGKPYSIPAQTGKAGCHNFPSEYCFGLRSKGPIVPGTYSIDASKISEPGLVHRFLRQLGGDWGSFRVPLEADPETAARIRALGRDPDTFFLHGGKRPGSGGCIDCGGGLSGDANTRRLLSDLRASPGGRSSLIVHGRLIGAP